MGSGVKVNKLLLHRLVYIIFYFYLTYRYINSSDSDDSITIAYTGVNNVDIAALSSMVDNL